MDLGQETDIRAIGVIKLIGGAGVHFTSALRLALPLHTLHFTLPSHWAIGVFSPTNELAGFEGSV